MRVTVIPIITGAFETIAKESGRVRKQDSWNHPNYRIVKIGQNTGKSPGNQMRLVVSQTSMKAYQLTLV